MQQETITVADRMRSILGQEDKPKDYKVLARTLDMDFLLKRIEEKSREDKKELVVDCSGVKQENLEACQALLTSPEYAFEVFFDKDLMIIGW